MELLAHVWGSDEAKEGMDAFLAGRAPDFQQFRMRDKKELERYMDGYHKDENAPPHMRGANARESAPRAGGKRLEPQNAAAKAAKGAKKSARR
jgi:hypothetical protein